MIGMIFIVVFSVLIFALMHDDERAQIDPPEDPAELPPALVVKRLEHDNDIFGHDVCCPYCMREVERRIEEFR